MPCSEADKICCFRYTDEQKALPLKGNIERNGVLRIAVITIESITEKITKKKNKEKEQRERTKIKSITGKKNFKKEL